VHAANEWDNYIKVRAIVNDCVQGSVSAQPTRRDGCDGSLQALGVTAQPHSLPSAAKSNSLGRSLSPIMKDNLNLALERVLVYHA
jgi:hypothetical protein